MVRRVFDSPPGRSLAFVGVVAVAYTLLGVGEGSHRLASSVEWKTWKMATAISLCIVVVSAWVGIIHLTLFNERHRAPSGLVPIRGRVFGWFSLGAALFIGAAVLLLQTQITGVGRTWPVARVAVRAQVVVIIACAAAVPWLVLVWLTHQTARDLRAMSKVPLGPLQALWGQTTACVLSFAVFVVIALIPTGVLRAVWFAQSPKPADATFPSAQVLLYGSYFALALAAITLPLIASWRRTAQALIAGEWTIASAGDLAKTAEARTALTAFLGLDKGLLRSPLAAVGIFTPLITSVLAAFVPELAP